MELFELWWRALDPCCCLAFLCWFHASFIIHFHTKQTTLSMSVMGTIVTLSESLCSPSPTFFHFLSSPVLVLFHLLFKLLTFHSLFMFTTLSLSSDPATLAVSLFYSPSLLPAVGWLSSKSLHLFPVNILLQHPVRHQESVAQTSRLIVNFSHVRGFSFSPRLPPSWTESHGCVLQVSLSS